MTRKAIHDRPLVDLQNIAGDPMPTPLEFVPFTPLPGILPPELPLETVPADRSQAAKLAAHLFNVTPGDEDRELVSEFQRSNGLNDTGVYGPGTATAFVPFGIVPPKPFFWPRKGFNHAKAAYKLTLLEQSKRDPQRSDEWAAAANV
jgi:hypothetical protein